MSDEPFGTRLRRERERRQIALSSICANTKINVALFEGLERGDISRWPSGIFRRAFIRAYAAGIGLDPDAIAREFFEVYPDPSEIAPVVPAESPQSASPGLEGIRLTLADAGASFAKGRLLADMRKRLAAVACDAGVVTAAALTVFVASGEFWLPLGVSMFAYYLGGILLLGNTPGVCLWAPGGHGDSASTTITARIALLKHGPMKQALAFLRRIGRSPSVPTRAQETLRS